jgi:hypothetical protein
MIMNTKRTLITGLVFAALGWTGIQGQAFASDNFDHQHGRNGHPVAKFSTDQQRRINAIDSRLNMQRQRIQEGYRTGKLTKSEYLSLMREHHQIRIQERKYLVDGFMGPREFAALDSALDQASKRIMIEKHDKQMRMDPHSTPDYRHRN